MPKRRTSLHAQDAGNAPDVATPKIDFLTAAQRFIDEQTLKNRTPRTLAWYRENLHTLRVFLERQDVPTDPALITEKSLKTHYVLYMLQTLKLSPVTVNGRIRTMKSFFAFLCDEGYVQSNPAHAITLVATEKTVIQAFSDSDVKRLLATPRQDTFAGFRDYVIMCLLLETGMRLKEIAEIRLDDIRWGDSGILVNGKGRKWRLVPFQARMRRLLQKYVQIRGNIEGENHLFITVDSNPMTRRNIEERIEIYGRNAGLTNVRVSPHTFRHTFAKLYIKNGGDIFSLQSILGHSTLDMVRHYVNLFSNEVAEQHRKYSPLQNMNSL